MRSFDVPPGRVRARRSAAPASASEPPAVEMCRVSKSYREGDSQHVVLRDVDAAIHTGQIAVLVGRSGSGKSTLLNLITGMGLRTEGSGRFDDTVLPASSRRQ